ncbi:MAG: LuxR C-terminal-related transcriptional regulator [Alphaproteobacteria bacterium]
MEGATALIVSHDTLFRQALEQLLGSLNMTVLSGIDDVSVAKSKALRGKTPDVILFDLPVESDTFAQDLHHLRTTFPQAKVVILTGRPSEHTMAISLDNGAVGYLTKNITADVLGKCLTLVMLDVTVWSTRMAAILASRRSIASRLSKREFEVLNLLARGDPNKQIARELNISEQTVKSHVRSLIRRFNVKNRVQLAIWARANGIVGGDQTANGMSAVARRRLRR